MRSPLAIVLFNLIIIFCSQNVSAQTHFSKIWDNSYGGNNRETIADFIELNDGSIIIGGSSLSDSSSDVSQPSRGSQDFWIIKIDFSGNKLWDKRYGGSAFDDLKSIQKTCDGGFILGGSSRSNISGEKSEMLRDTTFLAYGDFWIIKIDSLGNKLWDKSFGGGGDDEFVDIIETVDGGFLLGGTSNSYMSIDKSENNKGGKDFWIIKTDNLGNRIWDKTIGADQTEYLASIQETKSGYFYLGGYTASGINQDITQSSRGVTDYILFKLDLSGNIIWDKRYGGDNTDNLWSMFNVGDTAFILSGLSSSLISGEKTVAPWNPTRTDFWVIKIDTNGTIIWDNTFGGMRQEDEQNSIIATCDGGALICGTSYSDNDGNKTEYNMGQEQTWCIKTDVNGNYKWDKTLQTNIVGDDECGFGFQCKDGSYILANNTLANTGGDKTTISHGLYDIWLIKYRDTTLTCTNQINNPCEKIDPVNPTASNELEMPNVFSPNGDAMNESFEPKNKINYSNGKLIIYNRWGQNIFETKEINSGWNGKDFSEGVYYWIIDYIDDFGKNISKKGYVTLIRR